MFIFLDTVNHWEPGKAGELTYYQFSQRMEIATMEPIKYITKTTSKQDDTEAFQLARNALIAQGTDNPSLAQIATVVARSK